MDLRARLQVLADTLPESGSVTFTRADLLVMLGGENGIATNSDERATGGDLTLEEAAAQVKRAVSTVRGWCASGVIAGIYKLNGRDWRIPPAALRAFLDGQGRGTRIGSKARNGKAPTISNWRNLRKTG